MKNKKDFFLLMLFLFIVHGMLLTMDTVLFESTWFVTWAELGEFQLMKSYMANTGHPFTYWYFAGLFHFSNYVFLHKLFVLICICSSGWLIYKTLFHLNFFTKQDALLISILTMTFPVYYHHSEIYRLPHTIGFTAFFAATALYSSSIRTKEIGNKILSYLLFIVAFRAPSMLVFSYAFLGALVVKEYNHNESIWQQGVAFVMKHKALMLLPILDYGLMKLFFPAASWFANYNSLNFNINSLKRMILSCFGVFVEPASRGIHFLTEDPVSFFTIALVIGVATILATSLIKKNTVELEFSKKWNRVFLFGAFLFAIAIFPFAATGKYVSGIDVNSRNAFLLGLPIAILLVSLLKMIFRSNQKYSLIGGYLIIFVFAVLLNQRYLLAHNHHAKILAIGHNLKETPLPTNSHFYLFSDRVKAGFGRNINPLEFKRILDPYCQEVSCFSYYFPRMTELDLLSAFKKPNTLLESIREPWEWDKNWSSKHQSSKKISSEFLQVLKRKIYFKENKAFIRTIKIESERGNEEVTFKGEWLEQPITVVLLNSKYKGSEIRLWWDYITKTSMKEFSESLLTVEIKQEVVSTKERIDLMYP